MHKLLTLLVLAATLALTAPAFADDWTITKLRGGVQLLIGDVWTDLRRGDIIPNEQTVRTLDDGHADLQRGQEIIRLDVNTQIAINDKTDAIYTIVHQESGRVEVEAEVRNVEHFSVENRYLAAVVKGTHFVVTATPDSASVTVDRGAVAVESVASQRRTTISIGQTVSVEPATDMRLSGDGAMPAIFSADGAVFQAAIAAPPASGDGGAAKTNLASAFAKPGSGNASSGSAGTTFLASGGGDSPAVQTAMLANPATAGVLELRGGSSSDSGAGALALPAAAPIAVEEPPINMATLLVGLLLGIVIGAMALLLRRSV
jgi:hypothetical protein